jgi:hypothetical protein
MAAAFFARQSGRVEREQTDHSRVPSDVFIQHRAYIAGSILSAVSFLEAEINEIFMDAVDDQREHIHQLGDKIFLFADLWRLGVPRTASFPILEKYEIALALAQQQPIERGALIYQDVKLLIGLRNALIHYEPESAISDSPSSRKQEAKFRGKFQLNTLTGSRTPFFPERCMSFGCAKWAVESSIKFVDEFCSRLGITPVFDGVRTSLKID